MNQLISHSRHTIESDDLVCITKSFESKMISSGSLNKKFTQKLSNHLNKDKVSLFSSGSSALFHILIALGLGTKKDLISAYAWSKIAIENGYKSHKIRDNVSMHLTPAMQYDAEIFILKLKKGIYND